MIRCPGAIAKLLDGPWLFSRLNSTKTAVSATPRSPYDLARKKAKFTYPACTGCYSPISSDAKERTSRPVSNSLLSLPVLAHTHADLLHHTLSPPPGSLASRQDPRGESFVFGIDFTISLAHQTTQSSVARDGDMQYGSRPDPSLSVFHSVAIDAHTPVGSVVNSAPPPALSFDHGRAGIG